MTKQDARITRTKGLIYDAFIKLMGESGFEGITINDLTQRAGLNRGTFYLHYKDKFDLLEEIENSLLAGLMEIYQTFSPLTLLNHPSFDEPHPTILHIFTYFSEHADYFNVLLSPKGDPGFASRIKKLMIDQIGKRIALDLPGEHNTIIPIDLLLAYVTSANLGVIQYWLENGQIYSPNYMALLMTRIGKLSPIQMTGLRQTI